MKKTEFERQGILFCLIGPAGSGKTTIANKLLQKHKKTLKQSISYTTREKRDTERQGKSYHFVDPKTFQKLDKQGKFFEKENIHGQYYATPLSSIEDATKRGKDILLVVDIKGALNFRTNFPRNCVICVLLPPRFAELKKRMSARGKVSKAELQRRLETAKKEIKKLRQLRKNRSFIDYLIKNDDIKQSFEKVNAILAAERAAFKRITDSELLK